MFYLEILRPLKSLPSKVQFCSFIVKEISLLIYQELYIQISCNFLMHLKKKCNVNISYQNKQKVLLILPVI